MSSDIWCAGWQDLKTQEKRCALLAWLILQHKMDALDAVVDVATGKLKSGLEICMWMTKRSPSTSLRPFWMEKKDTLAASTQLFENAILLAADNKETTPDKIKDLEHKASTLSRDDFRLLVLTEYKKWNLPVFVFVKPDGSVRSPKDILAFLARFPAPSRWKPLLKTSWKVLSVAGSVGKTIAWFALRVYLQGLIIEFGTAFYDSWRMSGMAKDEEEIMKMLFGLKAFKDVQRLVRTWMLHNHPDKFQGPQKLIQERLVQKVNAVYDMLKHLHRNYGS